MGKKYAPHLADIFLLYFDDKAIKGNGLKPKAYFRYLDDIWLVWPGNKQTLSDYQTFLNGLINSIEVKLEAHEFICEFLDTYVYKHFENDICTLRTCVFFKPTDTHQLLHGKSFHPPHTNRAVVRSQLIRFRRLCSTKTEYDWASQTLFSVLLKRGYKKRDLRRAKNEIWYNYDQTLVTLEALDNTPIWPMVLHSDSIGRQLAKAWRNILTSCEILRGHKLVTAFKIHKNLKQILIRSKLIDHTTTITN